MSDGLPHCRSPGACLSTSPERGRHCRGCGRAIAAATRAARPEVEAARAAKVAEASRTPERRARARETLAATMADPGAAARRDAAVAETVRTPERRALSRSLMEAVNADPAVRPAIVSNGRAQAARRAGSRRLAAAGRLKIPVEWLAQVRRVQRAGMTEAEAVRVVADDASRRERARAAAWPFDPLERGVYGLLMIDPPWQFETRGAPGARAAPYGLMSLYGLMDLPVRELAADDCWLWLWGLTEMVPHALALIEAWGFNSVTSGTWIKTTASGKLCFGKGYVLRNSEEPYYLARRGRPRVVSRGERNTIMAPRGAHSEKPDEAYAKAERLFGDVRRAEVFSRRNRPGWEAFGDEAGKFDAP